MHNQGETFDKGFTCEKEVNNKVEESYYHIKNLGKVGKYLTQVTTETMVHVFISTKLDCANALHVGLINKLKYILNSATSIVNANMDTLLR